MTESESAHWDSDCMYCFFWGQFAEAMAAIDSEWAGKPAPEHPCTNYWEDDAVSCAHADVRYCADHRGAVACFDCGRLFGHLGADGAFVAHKSRSPFVGPLTLYSMARGHCEPHDLPLLAGHYCVMCGLAERDRAEAHRSGPRAPFVGGPESTS